LRKNSNAGECGYSSNAAGYRSNFEEKTPDRPREGHGKDISYSFFVSSALHQTASTVDANM
jgi:hypothetical protein